jgi:hypothetical protein
MYNNEAYWLISKEGRTSFKKGHLIGQAASNAALVSAIAVTAAVVAMPFWALLGAGSLGLVTLYKGAQYLFAREEMDALGTAVFKKPSLEEKSKTSLFKEGLKHGLALPLKRFWLSVVLAPFAVLAVPADMLLNKGTKGYFMFPRHTPLTPQQETAHENEARQYFSPILGQMTPQEEKLRARKSYTQLCKEFNATGSSEKRPSVSEIPSSGQQPKP